MGKQIERQEIVDTYSELINRLYRKKDDLLAATKRVVELTERAKTANFARSIEEIKKGVNIIVECLSELRPHVTNDRLVGLLYAHATRLLALASLSDKKRDIMWPMLKHEFQQFCQFANEVSIKPTRKSLEMALGIKIGGDWIRLQGLLHKKVSDH
jgi:hypothetical protein